MITRLKPSALFLAAVAMLTLSACQGTNGVQAANTSTSASTATHNTENPPPPATATTERSGPR